MAVGLSGPLQRSRLTALLGSGFDPGVTNVFCAYAQKHLFDEIETIDILDANAGDHGYHFATNFNPEINIREITANGRYWETGEWKEVEPMSIHQVYDFPVVGPQDAYLLYHEELESLCRNIKGLKRIRFWMTFSQKYLTHLKVLENVGMTSITPIDFKGQKIQPIEFLKAVLPDPASLGPRTKGKTCIGCDIVGTKDGQKKRIFIYNTCDHEDCYKEVSSQAISYTTGPIPAMENHKIFSSEALPVALVVHLHTASRRTATKFSASRPMPNRRVPFEKKQASNRDLRCHDPDALEETFNSLARPRRIDAYVHAIGSIYSNRLT